MPKLPLGRQVGPGPGISQRAQARNPRIANFETADKLNKAAGGLAELHAAAAEDADNDVVTVAVAEHRLAMNKVRREMLGRKLGSAKGTTEEALGKYREKQDELAKKLNAGQAEKFGEVIDKGRPTFERPIGDGEMAQLTKQAEGARESIANNFMNDAEKELVSDEAFDENLNGAVAVHLEAERRGGKENEAVIWENVQGKIQRVFINRVGGMIDQGRVKEAASFLKDPKYRRLITQETLSKLEPLIEEGGNLAYAQEVADWAERNAGSPEGIASKLRERMMKEMAAAKTPAEKERLAKVRKAGMGIARGRQTDRKTEDEGRKDRHFETQSDKLQRALLKNPGFFNSGEPAVIKLLGKTAWLSMGEAERKTLLGQVQAPANSDVGLLQKILVKSPADIAAMPQREYMKTYVHMNQSDRKLLDRIRRQKKDKDGKSQVISDREALLVAARADKRIRDGTGADMNATEAKEWALLSRLFNQIRESRPDADPAAIAKEVVDSLGAREAGSTGAWGWLKDKLGIEPGDTDTKGDDATWLASIRERSGKGIPIGEGDIDRYKDEAEKISERLPNFGTSLPIERQAEFIHLMLKNDKAPLTPKEQARFNLLYGRAKSGDTSVL